MTIVATHDEGSLREGARQSVVLYTFLGVGIRIQEGMHCEKYVLADGTFGNNRLTL